MTDIDTMPAGREMDAKVAEAIHWCPSHTHDYRDFSTDAREALLAIHEFCLQEEPEEWEFDLRFHAGWCEAELWAKAEREWSMTTYRASTHGNTLSALAMAICRAVLTAAKEQGGLAE